MSATILWNEIPESLRNCTTLKSFLNLHICKIILIHRHIAILISFSISWTFCLLHVAVLLL